MRVATQSDGKSTSRKSGDNSEEVTPVPISNTVVKLLSADDTWWEAAWESMVSFDPLCGVEALTR